MSFGFAVWILVCLALLLLLARTTLAILKWKKRSSMQQTDEELLQQQRRLVENFSQQRIPRQNEALYEEIRERMRVEEKLRHLAYHDPLTGLSNRAYLLNVLGDELNSARGAAKTRGFLLYMDLDRFQTVNGLWGHHIGDLLLKEVAHRLRVSTRSEDILIRLGGDEFAILITRIYDREQAARMAERLLGVIEEPADLEGISFSVTASIGLCVLDADRTSAEEVLRGADVALQHAKKAGGNTYSFYDAAEGDAIFLRLQTTLQLKQALERKEFELHYQPIVDLRDLSIYGVESLVRWRHPIRGMISPGEFVRLAEETGYIVPLGSWVLEQTCADMQTIRQTLKTDLLASINVSSQQLEKAGFLTGLSDALAKYQVPPQSVQLEVTESITLKDAGQTGALFQQIQAMGVSIAFDDFGTGYSSLLYLQKYPIDAIKIDQSFVRNMQKDAVSSGIVQFLVELSRSTGMRISAEGVEEPAQAQALMECGCFYAQGYLYSRPVPLKDLLELLRHGLKAGFASHLR
ncbi:MAG: bifunctional diguanylate cyclase/phosphodiesterase [Bacillota bacterium]|nr:bifunctional diguanylate cyclase/phosphodiesterase [Bacillota bacterium]